MLIQDGPTKLRRLTPDDIEAFTAYRADLEVALYQSWDAMTDTQALGFLSAMQGVDPLMQPDQWTQIAVADARSDALLGDMGWYLSQDSAEVELGITLARAHQGHGHATRAMTMACALLFDTTPARCMVAYADLRNTASRALMRRAGFKSLGTEVYEGVDEEKFEFLRPPSTQT